MLGDNYTHEDQLFLDEYQDLAMTTCMPSSNNFSYMFGNLVGEVGEFISKIAKAQREGLLHYHDSGSFIYDTERMKEEGIDYHEFDEELMKEMGDILWQYAGVCEVMGWNMNDIAKMNLTKLASRKKRGVIDGNGDNR